MKWLRQAEIKIYDSFAQAEEADYAYYRSLSGDEKLQLMLRLVESAYEADEGFKRVFRVIERARR